MKTLPTWIGLWCLSCLLVACDTGSNFAPVIDANGHVMSEHPPQPMRKVFVPPQQHVEAYAKRPFRQLTTAQPAPIEINKQRMQVMLPSSPAVVAESQLGWRWPVKGRIITPFSANNKGVNIAGYLGEPIYAAASGKVVYSGNGLPGYGNLIILEHAHYYFSAYAHTNKLMVRAGDTVKKGQQIAEMGKTGTDKVMLHFEIREQSKPIDPIRFLKMV